MAAVEIDMGDFRAFFQRMSEAGRGGLRKDMELWLEAVGLFFLEQAQNRFIARHKNKGDGQTVSALWQSFEKGNDKNVWQFTDSGMTLEVGVDLDYAAYANYGHRTLDPAKGKYFALPNGEMARFVPGHWTAPPPNGRFIYEPGAETGMVLKYHWVKGIHFWEWALEKVEKEMPGMLETKLQEWIDKYLG